MEKFHEELEKFKDLMRSTEKPKPKGRQKKTSEEIQLLAGVGLVVGYVNSYIGNVIGNIIARQPDILRDNLFPETYISNLTVAMIAAVYFDLPPLALAVITTGVFYTLNKSIKLMINRPSLTEEQILESFLVDVFTIYILLQLYRFYLGIAKVMYKYDYWKPIEPEKPERFSFLRKITQVLSAQFIITILLAVHQSLRNIARRERGEPTEDVTSQSAQNETN